YCTFTDLTAFNVAKGVLLTSGSASTDVALCQFVGLFVDFTGAYGVSIEAADNNSFYDYIAQRRSGTGDALQLLDLNGILFGSRYNYFWHMNGGGTVAGAAVVCNSAYR